MRGRGQPAAAAEGPRRTLQVDARSQGSGRSPSVSPERGSTPTSPYSVPQIAPLPSSTLCPICKTTELTSSPGQPNFNACTQCHSKVCNQCGFNPNPHLTQLLCHPLAMSKLRGQTGQILKLETSKNERKRPEQQAGEMCPPVLQRGSSGALLPPATSPLSNEHSPAFPLDGSRSTNTQAHLFSKAQIILNHPSPYQSAPAGARISHSAAAGVAGSALPLLIATSQQLFEALSPKSKRACHCS